MALIDSLLNLVGLLLWLSATGFGAVAIQRQPLTLASNLRPVTKVVPRGWPYMAGLLVLLLVRGLFYWNVGRSLGWVAVWSPGPMSVMFRSDYLLRMVAYSFLSFGWILMMVYGSMALLAALHRDGEPGELIGRVVNALGQPVDGKGPITSKRFAPIERLAPGVVDRQSVKEQIGRAHV